jgi:predicted phosphodiesterase
MTKADLCRQYLDKHPEYSNRKLARIIYAREGAMFKDEENVRFMLRAVQGSAKGTNSRVTHKRETPRPLNPYKLPDSDEVNFEPYILRGHKRIGLLSDIHIPYHSIEALTAAIAFLKKEKPDALVLNGDALDFHSLSRFNRDPRKKNFALELDIWKQMFDVFARELKCKIYYKLGNHEARYEHYLWMKAGELIGVDEFELSNLLGARASGITIIKDKTIIQAGSLNIIHGHEFGGSVFSPVNIARGLYLKGKVSAIQGHNHQVSEHTEPNMNGDIVTTWSQGCLCELHPEYLPINKWAHGFAVVDLDGKEFQVRNKRIWKGKIL